LAGYRITYADNAVAYTEAPDTFEGLIKQRFRWSFGSLQCMWKHRSAMLDRKSGALGLLAMPHVWLFHIIFPALSPLLDLMFVWTLVDQLIQRLEHPQEFIEAHLVAVAWFYAFFLAVDLFYVFVGYMFEKEEDWKLLFWAPLQRFGYRQLMYLVVWKSLKAAVRGATVGWNKLERKSTVEEIS